MTTGFVLTAEWKIISELAALVHRGVHCFFKDTLDNVCLHY